jgi:hypothetical protein
MNNSRCIKCVLSAAFPGIEFDANGVCNFCRGEIIASTQQTSIEKAGEELKCLLDGRQPGGEYDAIMCFSGGKDSTYTLKLAVQKYGLRVLSFTLDNGFISPGAFQNINSVVEALGVDHFTFKPSSKIFTEIIKTAAFKKVFSPGTLRRISSGCNACISIVNNTALRIALEKKIPLILAGFTLGQIPANSIIYKNNYQFLMDSRKRSLQIFQETIGDHALAYFTLPDYLVAGDVQYPDTVNLLCLENITEDEIVQDVEAFGWKKPKDVDGCSSNCRLNVFNNYIHQRTYGYSPYELELSHLIRSGLLPRQQALDKINDQSEEQINLITEKLGLSKDQLSQLQGKSKK